MQTSSLFVLLFVPACAASFVAGYLCCKKYRYAIDHGLRVLRGHWRDMTGRPDPHGRMALKRALQKHKKRIRP